MSDTPITLEIPLYGADIAAELQRENPSNVRVHNPIQRGDTIRLFVEFSGPHAEKLKAYAEFLLAKTAPSATPDKRDTETPETNPLRHVVQAHDALMKQAWD